MDVDRKAKRQSSRCARWLAGDVMAVSVEAMLELVHAVCDQRFEDATTIADRHGFTSADVDEAVALIIYELRRRADNRDVCSGPHRRAYRLLRSYLTPAQNAQLTGTRKYFDVIGSAGGRYRLWPSVGLCEVTAPYGKRTYRVGACCYHEPARTLPRPDLTLAHLLYLTADEPGFLAAANVSVSYPNNGWRRLTLHRWMDGEIEADAIPHVEAA